MAKKDKKAKKAAGSGSQEPLDALRSAFERTFQATTEGAASTQKRTRELVDEVAHAAARIREAIDDRRVLEELKAIRSELEDLAGRVRALESDGVAKPAATATRGRRTTASSKASGAARPAAAKTKSTASRAKKSASTSRSRSTSARSGSGKSGSSS